MPPPTPQLLSFQAQGLQGLLRGVRPSGTLEVALPFGRGYLHPTALALRQQVVCAGGMAGDLLAVRPDGFLVVSLPFGLGVLHPTALLAVRQ